jgi:alpha-L-fucosidase
MAWWREARFGLFVHWGVYSVPAGEYQGHKVPHLAEWIMNAARIPKEEYRKFAAGFNPKEYDARQWVDAARKCGARYMVVTAKHHDGFALFDSKVTDWDAVDATPAKRDLLGELAAACRDAKMPLGFHYSHAQDWWHPGGASYGKPWDAAQAGNFDEYLDRIAIPQIRELNERYGPVACLFFDTPAKMTPQRAQRVAAAVPAQTILNDRLGSMARWDYRCAENRMPKGNAPAADWELCRTMNGTWGFRKEPTNWISARDLLRELVMTASMGGNYLLNVGPDADGRFPPQAMERLEAIGAWLAAFGDSVYGTRAFRLPEQQWKGVATLKPASDGTCKVFLHLFDWPANGTLDVAGLAEKPASTRLLGGSAELTTEGGHGLWTIRGLPPDPVHPDVSVVELTFAEQPQTTKPPTAAQSGGSWLLAAASATLSNGGLRLGRAPDDPSLAIRDWKGPDATASWRVSAPKALGVSVTLDISAPALKTDLNGTVQVAGRDAGTFVIPASEGPSRRKVQVKPVELPVGLPVVAVKLSGSAEEPPLVLHSVTLAPVQP